MLHLFCPDYRCGKIADISVAWLQAQGVKKLILDVDNTLLPWDAMEASAENLEWLECVHAAGIGIMLLSNNGGARLKHIREQVGLPAVSWAAKPLPLGFKRALHQMSLEGRSEVLVIGDQLITDVLGAKSLGLKVMWVKSLAEKEFLVTRLTRKVEKIVINRLVQKGMMPAGGCNEDSIAANDDTREG